MEELRPCPFCGGGAELAFGGEGSCTTKGKSFVRCKVCNALGEKFEVSPRYCSDDKAIEAWNRRASE